MSEETDTNAVPQDPAAKITPAVKREAKPRNLDADAPVRNLDQTKKVVKIFRAGGDVREREVKPR
jgi:hypothetical protein